MAVAVTTGSAGTAAVSPAYDWRKILYLILASREIDGIEESRLVPEKKVLYQFSARGHETAQIILGSLLAHPRDSASAYYRSRPLLLSLGLTLEDAFAGPLARSGGFSDGRDIGVVCNLPSKGGATVLPMSGDVGSQFTPSAGWAQAIQFRARTLKDKAFEGAISTVLTGDAGVATNGFWSALTISTTLKLPLLFFVEDNGYGISVPSVFQTPGGNIADNLRSFKNLRVLEGDGSDPEHASGLIREAVDYVRGWNGPALLRLTVPRLSGHSGQDTQAYKGEAKIAEEKTRDPLIKLREFLERSVLERGEWEEIEKRVKADVAAALEGALARPEPDPANIKRYRYTERREGGAVEVQQVGGLLAEGVKLPAGDDTPSPQQPRINVVAALRKTLETELAANPRLLIFGEDVGPKGGVHAVTLGLQEQFGAERVFDTSLSEEGIIGRAVGMALNGLMPVAEIQFRKYADPATEQLNNCGTMRWRTVNRFAAPIVVRMPGGFAKCGDPWHSVCGEVQWAHNIGWQVAFASNAEDAVGLLRSAMRGNDPVIFFEHRHVLDSAWSRRPYPGDEFVVPFGKAATVRAGSELTLVTWGALVERCESAVKASARDVELIDLRTIMPWDKAAVLESVRKTRRCLIVHEDGITAGFGAEIAATLAAEAFFDLDAPIERLAVDDIPIPYNVALMDEVVPTVERIGEAIVRVVER